MTIAHAPIGTRLQGPRHAAGVHSPVGHSIARSQFKRVSHVHSNGPVWQWAAWDQDNNLVNVTESPDLWWLREYAAWNIQDGSRFVRSINYW